MRFDRPLRSTLLTSALSLAIGLPLAVSAQDTMPSPAPSDAATPRSMPAKPMARPDAQMQAVLDQLAKLGGKPLETLDASEARRQPTPTDAVIALLKVEGKSTAPEAVGKVENRTFDGPGGPLPIRIYTPAGKGPFPVVLYIHGGGWVIADLDTYDASPRAIANGAKAIVVSTHYRQGPEHKFPAAHDDTLAAWQWIAKHAGAIGGDPKRLVVVGESAGGNMAANVAIAARDHDDWPKPLRQVLIYPVADDDMNAPSYLENADAKPLNKPMMMWFSKHYLASSDQAKDPRMSLVDQPNLKGLPPATIINAQIDPLRSDGDKYADALRKAGVQVHHVGYDGVTHEFFGMAVVLDKAKAAQKVVDDDLKSAFARTPR